MRVASNIAPKGGGFEYVLEQAPVPGHAFTAQRVRWLGELSGTADALLAPPATEKKIEQAKAWLLARLRARGGKMLQKDIAAALQGMGEDFSMSTVRSAKKKLPIAVKKDADGWWWRLLGPGELGGMTL